MINASNYHHFAGRKILITGGLGFIGSNLAAALVDVGADVLLVDSLNPAYGGNRFNIAPFRDRVRVNISDIRDRYSLPPLIEDREIIFSLAGQTSHLDSMRDPYTDLEINCTAQLSLLEACRHHNPNAVIVYASTRQIYGRPRYLPVDEAHPLCPVDVNGINKISGEFYYRLYSDVYGMSTVTLRLTNTYGPRMRIKDERQTFLGVWIRNVLTGKPIEVWGGHQKRDYNYVDDVVEALMLAAIEPALRGRMFNVGSAEVLSLRETAETVIDLVPGASLSITEFPAERKKIDIGDYYSSFDLFRETCGWTPKVSFREGMERTVAYYREHLRHFLTEVHS